MSDPIRAGTMLEQLGRALWTNSETEAALKAHEEAVAIMPADPPTPALARVLSGYGQILMLLDRWTESLAVCERAVAMAREVGARQVEGHALNTLGLDRAVIGDCANATAPLEEAIAIAREVANADDIGRGYVNLCEAKRYCGDIRGALETVREGLVAADEVGINRTYGAFIRSNGVAYAFELGEWDEASRGRRRASRPCRPGVPSGATACRAGCRSWSPQGDERAGAACSTSCAASSRAFPSRPSSTTRSAPPSRRQPCGAGTPMRRSGDDLEGLRETQQNGVAALPDAVVPGGDARRGGPGRGGPGATRRRR